MRSSLRQISAPCAYDPHAHPLAHKPTPPTTPAPVLAPPTSTSSLLDVCRPRQSVSLFRSFLSLYVLFIRR